MTDLTKITTPFGLLDKETQKALREAVRCGKEIEIFGPLGWKKVSSNFGIDRAYRVKPGDLTDMVVPWAAIKPEYKWAAMDKDGIVWVYENRPTHGEKCWSGTGCAWAPAFILNITPGTKPWDQSLVQRPEGV